MARSRGASANFERLDRTGHYVSPAAVFLQKTKNLSGHITLQGPGAEAVPEPLPTLCYRADPKSWSRNMDAYELACLIDMAFRHPEKVGDGLVMTLTEAEYLALNGDMRRHFVRVRGEVKESISAPVEEEGAASPPPVENILGEALRERDELQRKLELKGIAFDRRWGLPRLRTEVEAQGL